MEVKSRKNAYCVVKCCVFEYVSSLEVLYESPLYPQGNFGEIFEKFEKNKI